MNKLEDHIETIEAGYEFLLAYAAQGRPAQAEIGPGPHARPTIEGMNEAVRALRGAFEDSDQEFERVIAEDCAKAGAALRFILAQDKIGSEMVDNLNASIHLRAVLTDLFLYSEALKPLPLDDKPGPVQSFEPSSQSTPGNSGRHP
ncbi:MAG: hypothetical protein OXF43_08195 [Gammaproteobacteria bacterium]|nr:hypothetical protein [Gammaproteobacteria bacterium]MCY4297395.1 hypothetical protein [Gammaproteobacteria bacterium]